MPWLAERWRGHWGPAAPEGGGVRSPSRTRGPSRSRSPRSPGPRHLWALADCETVRSQLPLIVDGSWRPTPAVAAHLAGCLSCQAEQASYRRLLRALRSLRSEDLKPVPGSLARALDALRLLPSGYDPLPARRRSTLVIAAVAAGTAILGAGALVVWGARHPRVLALGSYRT
jgi:hypothetical protein